MGLLLAMKAFWKALKDPKTAQDFVAPPLAIECQKDEKQQDSAHLRLLSHLQHSGRLVDFLLEDLDSFDDAQVGAAVREIHRGCRKCLDEMISVKPVLDDAEGTSIKIPKDYDVTRIKVVGKVIGEPPYSGVIVHRGWQARKKSLPKQTIYDGGDVITPAEVEIR